MQINLPLAYSFNKRSISVDSNRTNLLAPPPPPAPLHSSYCRQTNLKQLKFPDFPTKCRVCLCFQPLHHHTQVNPFAHLPQAAFTSAAVNITKNKQTTNAQSAALTMRNSHCVERGKCTRTANLSCKQLPKVIILLFH